MTKECRFKKRDLAKGIQRQAMPKLDEDEQINILESVEEGFILATTCQDSNEDLELWILDSACTSDVSGDKKKFAKLSKNNPVNLRLADDSVVKSSESGM
jgi:hypothetical protein